MDLKGLVITSLLTLLPISELRGAIPYALARSFPVFFVFPYCVLLNALVGPLAYLFLSTLHKIFYRWNWYKKLFDSLVIRARKKVQSKVDTYGYLGIMLFVAIPLPITGAWTGTLGAWILGLSKRKTCLAVLGGVFIAGIIVTLVAYFGLEAFSFFIKKV